MKDINDLKALKKNWKSVDLETKTLKSTELKHIIHQSSNSIVKKIFIISVIEFSLAILPLFFKSNYYLSKEIIEIQNNIYFACSDYVYYTILLYFILQFYNNFRKINVRSNLNDLSKNILRTRKSVYYYIYSSLFIFNLNSIVFVFLYLKNNSTYKNFVDLHESQNNLVIFQIILLILIISILTIISFVIWLIYKALYLRLIKKLNKNVIELNN